MPTGLPSSTTISCVILDELSSSQRLADELVGPHRLRLRRHHLLDREVEQVGAHVPAQVAVGDDADELAVGDR